MSAPGVGGAAHEEIRARHDFFAAWFAGRLDAAELDVAMTAFAPGFTHVGPDGAGTDRAQLHDMLASRRASKPDGFAIGIEALRTVLSEGPVAVVSYVEVQGDREPGARISTAAFRSDPRAPLGVAWLHVQETWLSPAERPRSHRTGHRMGERE